MSSEAVRREKRRLQNQIYRNSFGGTEPTSSDKHARKCWDCGNVAEHADSVTPWVLCSKCGSQDTRRVRPESLPIEGDDGYD